MKKKLTPKTSKKASTAKKASRSKKASSSTKASDNRQQIIVLEDGANNYYQLSRATLESCRVDKSDEKEIEKKLQERPGEFWYIDAPCIPGSVVAPPFDGGCQLHYAGFYLTSPKGKR